jgi:hypothetical protein
VVECLSSKHEALSSNPSTAKKKKVYSSKGAFIEHLLYARLNAWYFIVLLNSLPCKVVMVLFIYLLSFLPPSLAASPLLL